MKIRRLSKSSVQVGSKRRAFSRQNRCNKNLDLRTALSVSAQDIENISHDGNHNIATG
jgi:hypothetical protein